MTDFETWFHDNNDRLFRYWVYKRMFTPEEQGEKWADQSCFENEHCLFAFIEEAIELPDGDILLGMRDPEDDGSGQLAYYKLSEIRLAWCMDDKKEFLNG